MVEKNDKKGIGLEKNIAGFLSYILGWITGIIFWIIEKDSYVRFHAMQSILFSGVLTVLLFFIPLFYFLPGLIFVAWVIQLAAFILWVVLMVKAYSGEEWELPVIGRLTRQIIKNHQ